MEFDVIKNSRSGMVVARGGLGITAALSAISAVALPVLKAVGLGLLGAAAGFGWPVTLGFAGALLLVALIAFVAFKVLDGTEEGSKKLYEMKKEAEKRERQENIVHEHLLNQSLSGSDTSAASIPDSKAEIPSNDFVDLGPEAVLRGRLVAEGFTLDEIDKVFKHFKDHEDFQIALKREEYECLINYAINM